MAAASVFAETVHDERVTGGLLSTRDKAQELWEWLHNLEAMKYDHCEQLKRQRYEVGDKGGVTSPAALSAQVGGSATRITCCSLSSRWSHSETALTSSRNSE